MPLPDAPEVQADSGAVQNETDATAQKIDLSAPEIQAAIQQAAEAATKDFKKKVDEFRQNNIDMARQLEQWKSLGMDQEHLKEIVKNVSKNEETRLAAEGKFDELLALRTEPMRKDYETRLTAASSTIDELNSKLKAAEAENFDLAISNQVAIAAKNNPDVNADAIPIVVDFARRVWRREDDGEIVPRRPNGARWIGKDGKSDIQYDEWIDGPIREQYPSLFRAPTGPNVRGGPGRVSIDYLNQLPAMQRIEEARRMGITK